MFLGCSRGRPPGPWPGRNPLRRALGRVRRRPA
ncbi:hypothetical protein SFR_6097 [Streptomyces sp. FR-008]|nr:hypothetical protein SFR_6097 [Streptomyces sp. FR-008]